MSRGEQTITNQIPDVRRIVEARGFAAEDALTFVETASAAGQRPAFATMMERARRGEFEVVVIWALDRFGRSMVGNLGAVLELDRLGIEVISVRESWLDTGGPVRSLLLAIFSWMAEQERTRLGERTRAGLERARANGTKLGRPAARVDTRAARALMREGVSVRAIARRLKVPATTLSRALRAERGNLHANQNHHEK